MKVVESFDSPDGKFANTFGNIVVLDSNYFLALIQEMISELMM